MGRSSKVISMTKGHRTKAEKAYREEQENALLTGEGIVESKAVAADPAAHAVFLRVRKLLRKIGKSDALYEQVINRYAMLAAECADFERKREVFHERALALDRKYDEQDLDDADAIKAVDYFRLSAQLQGQVVALDKQVQAKRRMLLDIEKECVMTISSALRAIPKTLPDEAADDPLTKLIESRRGLG